MALFDTLLCFMGLALVLQQPSHAQNSQQDYTNADNVARKQAGVPNMTWDSTVTVYAHSYANSRISDCNMMHSGGTYRENLAKGRGSFTGTASVNLWVAEKHNFNYTSNSCVGGKQCLHYTQVIWKDSCVQCTYGWWFITCNYSPPGNYVGERPY